VLVLAEHFLQIFSRRSRRKAPKLTAAAKKKLGEHSWPGNIRELRNMMERVAFLLPEDQDRLDGADLQFILAPEGNAAEVLSLNATLNDASRRFQIEYIRRQITSARGNMTLAAERLGLHRSNLYRKMGQLGMETGDGE
jgi:Nif-specific regulatory protein